MKIESENGLIDPESLFNQIWDILEFSDFTSQVVSFSVLCTLVAEAIHLVHSPSDCEKSLEYFCYTVKNILLYKKENNL